MSDVLAHKKDHLMGGDQYIFPIPGEVVCSEL